MFYAIEYAYGRNVVNNGNRADRVLAFTRRELRDAWVADGPADQHASGYREAAGAREPMVRKAAWTDDGDREGWLVIAQRRVNGNARLRPYREIIFYDWPQSDHPRWVATADEKEIVGWAESIKRDWYAGSDE